MDKKTAKNNSAEKAQVLRWVIGTFLLAVFATIIILFRKNITIMRLDTWDDATFGLFKYGFILILVCSLFCLYRIMRGPTAPDRAVSLDMVGTLIVGLCALLGIVTKREWYIDIGIIWALQSFIGSLALAKYLEGRGFEE